jgi:hypothetical protein
VKILDKYVAGNFIFGYIIALMVLVGLRSVIDLFINLDEFAEHSDLGTWMVFGNVLNYYSVQSALYFRDFAGMITVVAAVFSLGRMTRNNELIAVMASGTSLKRVIAPIVLLAILFTGLLIVDQEFIIPRLANQLVRSHDSMSVEQTYDVWFMSDGNGSLVCTKNFNEKTRTMFKPTIIVRKPIPDTIRWRVLGKIQADSATYNSKKGRWELENGRFLKITEYGEQLALSQQPEPVAFYESDIIPKDIPVTQRHTGKTAGKIQIAAQFGSTGQIGQKGDKDKGPGCALQPEALPYHRPDYQHGDAYGRPSDSRLSRPEGDEIGHLDKLRRYDSLFYRDVCLQNGSYGSGLQPGKT